MKLNEFDIIDRYFKKSITRADVANDIGDDCAIVNVPSQQQLAISTDTLIAGVHFPQSTTPYDIGYKALAVNLSDLAAAGAAPAWAMLSLTLPENNSAWLTEFARGFFDLASRFNTQLIGGDITHGPLSITVTVHGFVPQGQALTRSGAKPGDQIYVSNTLGDAALALQFLTKKISLAENFQEKILTKLTRPQPQIELGKKLLNIAHAAIDISDGLAADLQHILDRSNVGAEIFVDQLPLSSELRASLPLAQAIELALTGGDDYELCFTVPADKKHLLADIPHLTCIGSITDTLGLHLKFQDGKKYHGPIQGYQHF